MGLQESHVEVSYCNWFSYSAISDFTENQNALFLSWLWKKYLLWVYVCHTNQIGTTVNNQIATDKEKAV